jgi:CP family cyanate transporter-like MFS transporter
VNRTPLWLGAALMLVALNLRLPITSVPPLLDDVRADLGLSVTATGLLTALPVLCFAVVGALAPRLARRWGAELVLLLCIGAIAGGILVRLVPAVAPLFAGTLVLGAGIAIANILVPAVIKRDYARPGGMMGAYAMTLNAGGALGAGLTVPVEHALDAPWELALAVWAVPALLAAVAWLPALRFARTTETDEPLPERRPPLWRDPLAWQLTGLMGFQSALFYCAVAWIPDILRDTGMSSATAGLMLSIVMLLGLPTSFLMPVLAGRRSDQRTLVAASGLGWLAGIVGLLLWPGTATALWMAIIGLAQGAGIGLALTLMVLRAPDGHVAAALSGMAQSLGYLLAGIAPVLVGLAHDASGGWRLPLALMAAGAIGLLACGLAAARPGLVGRHLEPAY